MTQPAEPRPDRDQLYATASGQDGFFTAPQAAEAGYSAQLITHHVRSGNFMRVRRGIYRLVRYPVGDHDGLVIAWLWSERIGVLSHETALALHDLSDVLPVRVHLTLPSEWKSRRLRVPSGVMLHHGDVADAEQTWFGPIPITTVARSLNDCSAELSPDLLRQGAQQALHRGLVRKSELVPVETALAPYGGIE